MQKTIPLQSVRDALMCAIVRQKARTVDGQRHGRTAAFTQSPYWLPNCRDRMRWGRRPQASVGGLPVDVIRQHFTVMDAGNMDRVLERTRQHHGLAEVRHTWGAGLHALKAEFAQGAMR